METASEASQIPDVMTAKWCATQQSSASILGPFPAQSSTSYKAYNQVSASTNQPAQSNTSYNHVSASTNQPAQSNTSYNQGSASTNHLAQSNTSYNHVSASTNQPAQSNTSYNQVSASTNHPAQSNTSYNQVSASTNHPAQSNTSYNQGSASTNHPAQSNTSYNQVSASTNHPAQSNTSYNHVSASTNQPVQSNTSYNQGSASTNQPAQSNTSYNQVSASTNQPAQSNTSYNQVSASTNQPAHSNTSYNQVSAFTNQPAQSNTSYNQVSASTNQPAQSNTSYNQVSASTNQPAQSNTSYNQVSASTNQPAQSNTSYNQVSASTNHRCHQGSDETGGDSQYFRPWENNEAASDAVLGPSRDQTICHSSKNPWDLPPVQLPETAPPNSPHEHSFQQTTISGHGYLSTPAFNDTAYCNVPGPVTSEQIGLRNDWWEGTDKPAYRASHSSVLPFSSTTQISSAEVPSDCGYGNIDAGQCVKSGHCWPQLPGAVANNAFPLPPPILPNSAGLSGSFPLPPPILPPPILPPPILPNSADLPGSGRQCVTTAPGQRTANTWSGGDSAMVLPNTLPSLEHLTSIPCSNEPLNFPMMPRLSSVACDRVVRKSDRPLYNLAGHGPGIVPSPQMESCFVANTAVVSSSTAAATRTSRDLPVRRIWLAEKALLDSTVPPQTEYSVEEIRCFQPMSKQLAETMSNQYGLNAPDVNTTETGCNDQAWTKVGGTGRNRTETGCNDQAWTEVGGTGSYRQHGDLKESPITHDNTDPAGSRVTTEAEDCISTNTGAALSSTSSAAVRCSVSVAMSDTCSTEALPAERRPKKGRFEKALKHLEEELTSQTTQRAGTVAADKLHTLAADGDGKKARDVTYLTGKLRHKTGCALKKRSCVSKSKALFKTSLNALQKHTKVAKKVRFGNVEITEIESKEEQKEKNICHWIDNSDRGTSEAENFVPRKIKKSQLFAEALKVKPPKTCGVSSRAKIEIKAKKLRQELKALKQRETVLKQKSADKNKARQSIERAESSLAQTASTTSVAVSDDTNSMITGEKVSKESSDGSTVVVDLHTRAVVKTADIGPEAARKVDSNSEIKTIPDPEAVATECGSLVHNLPDANGYSDADTSAAESSLGVQPKGGPSRLCGNASPEDLQSMPLMDANSEDFILDFLEHYHPSSPVPADCKNIDPSILCSFTDNSDYDSKLTSRQEGRPVSPEEEKDQQSGNGTITDQLQTVLLDVTGISPDTNVTKDSLDSLPPELLPFDRDMTEVLDIESCLSKKKQYSSNGSSSREYTAGAQPRSCMRGSASVKRGRKKWLPGRKRGEIFPPAWRRKGSGRGSTDTELLASAREFLGDDFSGKRLRQRNPNKRLTLGIRTRSDRVTGPKTTRKNGHHQIPEENCVQNDSAKNDGNHETTAAGAVQKDTDSVEVVKESSTAKKVDQKGSVRQAARHIKSDKDQVSVCSKWTAQQTGKRKKQKLYKGRAVMKVLLKDIVQSRMMASSDVIDPTQHSSELLDQPRERTSTTLADVHRLEQHAVTASCHSEGTERGHTCKKVLQKCKLRNTKQACGISKGKKKEQMKPHGVPFNGKSCVICSEPVFGDMRAHYKQIHPFRCVKCRKAFQSKDSTAHCVAEHDMECFQDANGWECNQCSSKEVCNYTDCLPLNIQKEKASHWRTTHSSSGIECKSCDRFFCSKFQWHMHTVSKDHLLAEGARKDQEAEVAVTNIPGPASEMVVADKTDSLSGECLSACSSHPVHSDVDRSPSNPVSVPSSHARWNSQMMIPDQSHIGPESQVVRCLAASSGLDAVEGDQQSQYAFLSSGSEGDSYSQFITQADNGTTYHIEIENVQDGSKWTGSTDTALTDADNHDVYHYILAGEPLVFDGAAMSGEDASRMPHTDPCQSALFQTCSTGTQTIESSSDSQRQACFQPSQASVWNTDCMDSMGVIVRQGQVEAEQQTKGDNWTEQIKGDNLTAQTVSMCEATDYVQTVLPRPSEVHESLGNDCSEVYASPASDCSDTAPLCQIANTFTLPSWPGNR